MVDESATEDGREGALVAPPDEPGKVPAADRSLEGDEALKSARKWALFRLPLVIIFSAWVLTQIGGLLGITAAVVVLGGALRKIIRQAQGLELPKAPAEDADAVAARVLKAGGFEGSDSLNDEETRVSIMDEIDRIRGRGDSWWGRGRWVGPTLGLGMAAFLAGLGTWGWLVADVTQAWAGWTLSSSMMLASWLHIRGERKKERAIELLEDQMADLADPQRQIESPDREE